MELPDPPDHTHGHTRYRGVIGAVGAALHLPGFGHGHEHGAASMAADRAVIDNDLGIRTVWLALLALGLTTALQIGIYLASNSVALLADTVHNLGDALNSIPLLIALYLARRAATRRYTYGFGRAEDIAGIVIVLSIGFSAAYILVASTYRLFFPQPLTNLPWVAAASIVGFVGNELVATMQLRVGKQIGSAAMVADGQHARTDGLTSLAVLIAVIGTWFGLPILDPVVGIVIGVAIVGISWTAAKAVWYRLMDAVDPSVINRMEHFAGEVPGVDNVISLRARWIGHRLYADITVEVDENLMLVESRGVAARIRQVLAQAIPHLESLHVEFEPRFEYSPSSDSPSSPTNFLPPRYQQLTPSAAPMGAAELAFGDDGQVAWNEIWTDFCDLALAGGPPHRGSLLEPVDPAKVAADPEGYERTITELERGLTMVTGLPVVHSEIPGWLGLECESEAMALWLLRAIVVENISIRREGNVLYFPAGPDFRLDKEIKNIVTVFAKTTHYWREHVGVESGRVETAGY